MPIIYSSDSENETTPRTKLFGRQRPIRSVLGGGQGTACFYVSNLAIVRSKTNILMLDYILSFIVSLQNRHIYIMFLKLCSWNLQLLMYYYGKTKKYQRHFLLEWLYCGFFSRLRSTILWLSSVTSPSLQCSLYSYGLPPQISSIGK